MARWGDKRESLSLIGGRLTSPRASVRLKSAHPRFENDIEAQFAGEAAASLGLAGRRLRKAIDALNKYDADVGAGTSRASSNRRADLVAVAGEAFWGYVVQRELLGLMDADYIAREYGVPPEVKSAMGPNLRKK